MRVEIRTAAEVLTPGLAAEWAARRARGDDPLLRAIWREFFRSEEELAAWRRETPDGDGAGLVLAEAFELGRRMFGDLLVP